MNKDIHPLEPDALVKLIEGVFGMPVRKITRPGGPKRAVYRVWIGSRTIIASYRPDAARAKAERMIQSRLAPICDRVPAYLGTRAGFTFQADAGAGRLNQRINALDGAGRQALARQAVESILDIQLAAASTDLPHLLPPIDTDPAWTERFATGPTRLARMTGTRMPDYNWRAVQQRITPTRLRFTKSDCRSGNGALDRRGHLRWFDFELSGLRHGAEDLAWLAADEIWPVPMPEMHEIIRDVTARRETGDHDDYMDMFQVYTTLQVSQRLRLILTEARQGGWVSRQRAVKYDYIGSDPGLGARLADNGAWLAAQNPMTADWVPVFEHTAQVFRDVLQAGRRAERT
jgi:hypothetical protein